MSIEAIDIPESDSAEHLFWCAETLCRGMGGHWRHVLVDAPRLRATTGALGAEIAAGLAWLSRDAGACSRSCAGASTGRCGCGGLRRAIPSSVTQHRIKKLYLHQAPPLVEDALWHNWTTAEAIKRSLTAHDH